MDASRWALSNHRVQACKLKVATSMYKSTQESSNVLPSVVLWVALYTAAGLLEACLTTLMPGILCLIIMEY